MTDFYIDRNATLIKEKQEWINDFYFSHYGEVLKKIETVFDIQTQKKGHDKILHFHDGTQMVVDEKFITEEHDYISLEEWSNVDKRIKGWTGDPDKTTDIIVHIVARAGRVIFLPYDILREEWKNNYTKWKDKYHVIKQHSHKGEYHWDSTHINVPFSELGEVFGYEISPIYCYPLVSAHQRK